MTNELRMAQRQKSLGHSLWVVSLVKSLRLATRAMANGQDAHGGRVFENPVVNNPRRDRHRADYAVGSPGRAVDLVTVGNDAQRLDGLLKFVDRPGGILRRALFDPIDDAVDIIKRLG